MAETSNSLSVDSVKPAKKVSPVKRFLLTKARAAEAAPQESDIAVKVLVLDCDCISLRTYTLLLCSYGTSFNVMKPPKTETTAVTMTMIWPGRAKCPNWHPLRMFVGHRVFLRYPVSSCQVGCRKPKTGKLTRFKFDSKIFETLQVCYSALNRHLKESNCVEPTATRSGRQQVHFVLDMAGQPKASMCL